MTIIYLNGEYLEKEKATISVMDRGFLFGDGVYEVIPVYNNKIFRGEQHIERLFASLAAIRLPTPLQKRDWLNIFNELVARNSQHGPNQAIYMQVTRGTSPDRNHAFPSDNKPTLFAYSYPLKPLPAETLAKGLAAMTSPDNRWQFCNIKSISLLPNILLYQQALDNGCAEAILIRDGYAIEGATSNLFIVKNGVIKTPPLSNLILGGITRELILEIARKEAIPFEEVAITESELLDADEVWITSSTREIYPITTVNSKPVKTGLPGEYWHKMSIYYKDYIKNI